MLIIYFARYNTLKVGIHAGIVGSQPTYDSIPRSPRAKYLSRDAVCVNFSERCRIVGTPSADSISQEGRCLIHLLPLIKFADISDTSGGSVIDRMLCYRIISWLASVPSELLCSCGAKSIILVTYRLALPATQSGDLFAKWEGYYLLCRLQWVRLNHPRSLELRCHCCRRI